MIFDNIKNSKIYYGINPKFKKAFDFIQEASKGKIEPGKYQIDGEDIYAVVQNYDSILKGNNLFEGHEKYIDIQYILDGCEVLGFFGVSNTVVEDEYNAETDAAFYKESDMVSYCVANKGDFCIFYPHDIHSPGICYNDMPSKVRKIVVKVHI